MWLIPRAVRDSADIRDSGFDGTFCESGGLKRRRWYGNFDEFHRFWMKEDQSMRCVLVAQSISRQKLKSLPPLRVFVCVAGTFICIDFQADNLIISERSMPCVFADTEAPVSVCCVNGGRNAIRERQSESSAGIIVKIKIECHLCDVSNAITAL